MCLAKAYLEQKSERELLLEDVVLLECDGKRIRMSTLFGDEREIEAVVKEVDFQGGSVIVERPAGAGGTDPVPSRREA
jgi:predicted RNA-binding protein